MSDSQEINNPKNKAYLDRALKDLACKTVDKRVSDIHKRIDKHNKQLAKKKPNTKNRTRAHAMPYTRRNGAPNDNK
ncbi:uncharacterized protein OCT59_017855 [Rhizophagus irregularis]|uniref:Uncharacterized protein n=2 Tax=Rhizophagus irregularis TaxID=588596 RepID=A0A015KNF3_RHIIW|nr:hypothetical protein RirG_099090 [Rhizophagus irregularis DAOM 197198w]UZO25590.1 hypothetical protein OCT59_017855 [Rhizophagus irregularis]CAG8732385.1 5148_t:CDS:2 [Rhizophagus irregularis]